MGLTQKFETLKDLQKFYDLQGRTITGIDDRGPHSSWLKSMFRKSPEWRSFSQSLISEKKYCERCGGNNTLIVHHRDPRNYDDLSSQKFVVLCSSCHLKIESFCGTEDSMKQCPKVDRKFLTFYPYKEKTEDIIGKQSGVYIARKWIKEMDTKDYINVTKASKTKKKEYKDAISFMKEHPELFK